MVSLNKRGVSGVLIKGLKQKLKYYSHNISDFFEAPIALQLYISILFKRLVNIGHNVLWLNKI